MDFYEMKYFCSICENRNYSKAAAVMHVSQPALSQCVQKLEAEFGAPLFQHSTRPLKPTEVGEIVYDYSKRMLELRNALDLSIKDVLHSDEVEIKVGMSPFYSKHYLPAILKKIRESFPNITLTMVEGISEKQEKMLLDGGLDFCCIPQEPEIDGVSYEPICIEEILLAIPSDSPINRFGIPSNPIPFMDVKYINGQKSVSLSNVQKINKLLSPLFDAYNIKCPVVYETLDWDTVKIMIANGIGVGFVPDILCTKDSSESSPNYYRVKEKGFIRTYSIAYKAGKTFTPLERRLIEVFKYSIEELRREQITFGVVSK